MWSFYLHIPECGIWDLPLGNGDSARIFILNLALVKLLEIHLPHFFQWVSSHFVCIKTKTVVQIFLMWHCDFDSGHNKWDYSLTLMPLQISRHVFLTWSLQLLKYCSSDFFSAIHCYKWWYIQKALKLSSTLSNLHTSSCVKITYDVCISYAVFLSFSQ